MATFWRLIWDTFPSDSARLRALEQHISTALLSGQLDPPNAVRFVGDEVVPVFDLALSTAQTTAISARYSASDCPNVGWRVVRIYLRGMPHAFAYGGTFTCHHLPREQDLELPSAVMRNRETNLRWAVEDNSIVIRHISSGDNTQAEYTVGQLH